MTCREKLAVEHPNKIAPDSPGGCYACPVTYGYLERPDWCHDKSNVNGDRCGECWDREIPGKKLEFEHRGEPIAKVKDIFEENGGITAMVEHTPAVQAWIEHMEEKESRILDSGNRTQFESGAVRDTREGKGRCDLMPLEVVSQVLGVGMIYDLKLFLASGNTTYLYACLQEFSTAYDDGKTKASAKAICDQRYCTMFLEVAKHFEEGAKKYGENNWQKGIPVHCYIDSAVRHYLKWLRGDKDEPHDRAFVWNLMCCIWEVDYHKEEK